MRSRLDTEARLFDAMTLSRAMMVSPAAITGSLSQCPRPASPCPARSPPAGAICRHRPRLAPWRTANVCTAREPRTGLPRRAHRAHDAVSCW